MSIAADCQDFFPISEGNEIYNNEYVIGELKLLLNGLKKWSRYRCGNFGSE